MALNPDEMLDSLRKHNSTRLESGTQPRFKVGDKVIVNNLHPAGHTRHPRYIRGKQGVIYRDHGSFIFPDTNAHNQGKKPQPVYSVSFEAREVWGPSAPANDKIYLDLSEDYLEAVNLF